MVRERTQYIIHAVQAKLCICQPSNILSMSRNRQIVVVGRYNAEIYSFVKPQKRTRCIQMSDRCTKTNVSFANHSPPNRAGGK